MRFIDFQSGVMLLFRVNLMAAAAQSTCNFFKAVVGKGANIADTVTPDSRVADESVCLGMAA